MTNPVYSHSQWDALLKESIERIEWLSRVKGGEYAKDGDRLANFRDNAIELGTSMELVWGVYARKHWDAIKNYISDIVQGKPCERSEPIESRIDDMIVYLLLFKAIVREKGAGGLANPATEEWDCPPRHPMVNELKNLVAKGHPSIVVHTPPKFNRFGDFWICAICGGKEAVATGTWNHVCAKKPL